MSVEVRIPTLGESVTEGVIVRWIKADGDAVQADEPLLELETDKASVEIPAERAGILRIVKAQGETVQVGEVVARLETGSAAAKETPTRKEAERAAPPAAPVNAIAQEASSPPPSAILSPAVRRLVEEHRLDPQSIQASGRGGRLTKADILAHLERAGKTADAPAAGPAGRHAAGRRVRGGT